MITIGFCGATHLGLCYSTAAAEKGFNVICFDYDKNKIKKLNSLDIEINEPKLKKLIKKNRAKIIFTDDISQFSKSNFVYFSYDVDTDKSGKSDENRLKKKLEYLIAKLNKNIPLIILSQVYPGFTRRYFKIKNNLYYQVETLVFGNALDRALKPERFIIGSNNPNVRIFNKIRIYLDSFNCPILIMKYESAELAKIAINCFLASSVTMTNTLAEISNIIGASWEEIIPTLRLDKRIGKFAYLKPGLGISGGNIERDLTTIKNIGKKYKSNVGMIKSIINLSKYNKNWLFKTISYYIKNQKNLEISIIGLAYKENTNSIKNSPSIELIKKIRHSKIKVYDPVVKEIKMKNIIECDNAYSAIEDTNILVVATPWEEFKKLDINIIASKMKGNIIIDPYKVLNKTSIDRLGFKYYFIG